MFRPEHDVRYSWTQISLVCCKFHSCTASHDKNVVAFWGLASRRQALRRPTINTPPAFQRTSRQVTRTVLLPFPFNQPGPPCKEYSLPRIGIGKVSRRVGWRKPGFDCRRRARDKVSSLLMIFCWTSVCGGVFRGDDDSSFAADYSWWSTVTYF